MTKTLLVGYDASPTQDIPVLTVAHKAYGQIQFVNVFTGIEATELYNKLTTPNLKGENNETDKHD